MYQVKRVNIDKTEQLNELAHACGELYTKTLVFFWRTVRHKGIWLKPKHLRSVFNCPQGSQRCLLCLGQTPNSRDVQSLVGAVASQRAEKLSAV